MPADKENIAIRNKRVANTYEGAKKELIPLMDEEIFHLWQSVINIVAEKETKCAIKFIRKTKKVFPVIPPSQRLQLLLATQRFAAKYPRTSLVFFSDAPLAIASLDKAGFEKWETTASKLVEKEEDIAIIFIQKTSRLLNDFELDEILDWIERGCQLFSTRPEAVQLFFEGIFTGLANHTRKTSRKQRNCLLEKGFKLALTNHRCVQSYFENAPPVIIELTKDDFKKWTSTGEKIAERSTFYGREYYNNSYTTLKRIKPVFYDLIFDNAQSLLEKEQLIAGIYFSKLREILLNIHPEELKPWVSTGIKLFERDREIAIQYFRNSPILLQDLEITELEEWAMKGLEIFENDSAGAGLYFSLKSGNSREFIEYLMSGVALKRVTKVLTYYALGISGINFNIRSRNLLPKDHVNSIQPVVSGKTIYLVPTMKGYGDFEDNFMIYKLSVMHEVGHQKFGTTEYATKAILSLLNKTSININSTPLEKIIGSVDDRENTVSLQDVISLFPEPSIATDIMGIVEDARIEYMTTHVYRGLRRDFEKVREKMVKNRKVPQNGSGKFMEAFLLSSVGHEPSFVVDEFLKILLEKARILLDLRIFQPKSSTLDSLEVTFEIYEMLEKNNLTENSQQYTSVQNLEYRGVGAGLHSGKEIDGDTGKTLERFIPLTELELDEKEITQENTQAGPKCALAKKWEVLSSFTYDEWDSRLRDYKSRWSTVYEVCPAGRPTDFYRDTLQNYIHEISLIKRIFRMMKPVSFRKLRRQNEGDEIDFDAITEAFTDRKCGINPTERLYIRRDKRERDVATLFLVDISASTSKKLDNNKSILDVEKEALVLMVEALESIGDKYAIYAFSGDTRNDVEYYTIKDFREVFSENIECKIDALEPADNTRLGPVIRHSITKLKGIDAKIKLLILLSDGEPYDFGVGDGKYDGEVAIEDTKMAIQEGKALGMHFFCITVDSKASDYMHSIFSDVGYTIIDNATTLPEKLPMLYNRLTT
ncbi:nitric oxide reductase activation protein NorD [Methanohalophilus halophilus]|uniref:VWA domain-containing protein n=1 Tax=Methanohalophilus halophilus TaxID=2177 RepID=A0A1L3Q0H6_9EURY|nr:VWA domain-containing protein [Methanohalophilus halophilus]APH38261.1 hypothetical protein BHR79_01355 [Methanohalophilus halophilus]RNI10871.1 VWA domain-containing protein [Methanohalophilus halophilus]SDW00486.1 von Willebrand factor type A domain-containing protein [Methanohalophilus halophilus]